MIFNIDRLDVLYKAIQALANQYLPSEREDLTQEIALDLWSKRARLPASFGAGYLHAVVRNAAYSRLRERQRKKNHYYLPNKNAFVSQSHNHYQSAQNPLDKSQLACDLASTLNALQKLSPEQRSALELAAKGYVYSEIAVIQGVAMGTVRSRLHYARRKIEALRNSTN